MKDYSIESWPPTRTLDTDLQQLATLLHATVHDGASVSFILPFTHDDSLDWWRSKILPLAMTYQRQILIARHTPTSTIVGSVQLILDMPPNQKHRGEVAKLLVHPHHRRQGLARSLMTALEHIAIDENRTLITLDTVTGSSAEPLYQSLGYQLSGTIPNYARAAQAPTLESTSIYYKQLSNQT